MAGEERAAMTDGIVDDHGYLTCDRCFRVAPTDILSDLCKDQSASSCALRLWREVSGPGRERPGFCAWRRRRRRAGTSHNGRSAYVCPGSRSEFDS